MVNILAGELELLYDKVKPMEFYREVFLEGEQVKQKLQTENKWEVCSWFAM